MAAHQALPSLGFSRLSVAAIAAETGYCSPSHLANTFHAATGVSPRARRNRL